MGVKMKETEVSTLVEKAERLAAKTNRINRRAMDAMEGFMLAGKELKEIEDNEEWRPTFKSLEEYFESEIIWGKTQCYNAIKLFKRCGEPVLENPELLKAGKTRSIKLIPFMTTKERTIELLHMAANCPNKGFEANLRNLRGKVAPDECDHINFEIWNRCRSCGKFFR